MHVIKSVGVFSVAKASGAIYGGIGLIVMPFLALISFVSFASGHNPFGALSGLAVAVIVPIFYGLVGFIGGALGAFVYNLVAKWLGGIEIRLESPFAAAPFPETTTSSIPG